MMYIKEVAPLDESSPHVREFWFRFQKFLFNLDDLFYTKNICDKICKISVKSACSIHNYYFCEIY